MIRRSKAEAVTETVFDHTVNSHWPIETIPPSIVVPDALSVLIVESYAPNIRLFTELSNHVGISTVNVPDLRAANTYLDENAVSAILLGCFGSHAGGAAWTRQFRFGKNNARRCPIFAMSDCTSRRDIALLRGAGVSEIIATPINIDAFYDAIDTYLVPEMDSVRLRTSMLPNYIPDQAQFRFG
jgi:DNA-binding response OmpR family regulator